MSLRKSLKKAGVTVFSGVATHVSQESAVTVLDPRRSLAFVFQFFSLSALVLWL